MPARLRQRVFTTLGILLGMALLTTACHKKVSEEDQVRKVIRQVATAASKADLNGIMKPTSKDFVATIQGGEQNMQRKMVKMMLFRYLRQQSKLQVILRSIDVEVKGLDATAKVMAMLSRDATSIEKIKSGQAHAQAVQFDLLLHKDNDDWKLTRAAYQQIDPKRLLLAE